jgi:GMP synthase (glutamine-hydrolysing)
MQHKVLILDFGSQYTQLIARRVRELNIFCEIFPYNSQNFNSQNYKAIILSGSPFSIRAADAPYLDLSEIKGKIPLLGVCFGAQFMAHNFGGKVASSNTREYGRANLSYIKENEPFFDNVSEGSQVWMSHSDTIVDLPENCELIASTHDVANAAFKTANEMTYGIQFHPEVYHTKDGLKILKNFLVKIAGIAQTWTPDSFV